MKLQFILKLDFTTDITNVFPAGFQPVRNREIFTYCRHRCKDNLLLLHSTHVFTHYWCSVFLTHYVLCWNIFPWCEMYFTWSSGIKYVTLTSRPVSIFLICVEYGNMHFFCVFIVTCSVRIWWRFVSKHEMQIRLKTINITWIVTHLGKHCSNTIMMCSNLPNLGCLDSDFIVYMKCYWKKAQDLINKSLQLLTKRWKGVMLTVHE